MKRPKIRVVPHRWHAQLHRNLEFAESYLKNHESLVPRFIIHCDKDAVVLTPWQNDDEKDRYLMIVKLMAIAHDAEAVTHLSEAWQRVVYRQHGESAADYEQRATEIRPSQVENRIEVVICTITYRDDDGDQKSAAISREIERSADGKVSGLTVIKGQEEPDYSTTGRMVEVLPPRGYSPEIRAAAKQTLDVLGLLQW